MILSKLRHLRSADSLDGAIDSGMQASAEAGARPGTYVLLK